MFPPRVGARSPGSLLTFILPLVVTGILAIPLGMAVFDWGERYAKRTGALKLNG